MSKTIAVIGAKGLLGSALIRYWNQSGEENSFNKEEDKLIPFDIPEFDLCARSFTLEAIKEARPQIVINAAGINNIDWLEKHPHSGRNFHLHGTANLQEAARHVGAFLVQFSCGELFYSEDSTGPAHKESDELSPQSIFARTKSDAEEAALEYSESLVVRCSTLFGESGPHSAGNLVETLLSAFRRTQKIHVLNDIAISPLWTFDLIRAVRFLIERQQKGIWHLASSNRTSPLEVANYLLNRSGLKKHETLPITCAEYGFTAPHSHNTTLNIEKYSALIGGPELPVWQDSIDRFLNSRQCF